MEEYYRYLIPNSWTTNLPEYRYARLMPSLIQEYTPGINATTQGNLGTPRVVPKTQKWIP